MTEEEKTCRICNSFHLEHRIFMFWSRPDEHEGDDTIPPEWQPSPDSIAIPQDDGPARVAYQFQDGEPTVQVYEGVWHGLWTPCFMHNVNNINYWTCSRRRPKDPCSIEFMKEISCGERT